MTDRKSLQYRSKAVLGRFCGGVDVLLAEGLGCPFAGSWRLLGSVGAALETEFNSGCVCENASELGDSVTGPC